MELLDQAVDLLLVARAEGLLHRLRPVGQSRGLIERATQVAAQFDLLAP